MATGLYKRGRFYWLRCDPVSGQRLSTRCTSIKSAEAFRVERERLAANPSYAASHSATLGKWVAELIRVKTETKSAGTADMYRTKSGHLVRLFGATAPMVDVTPTAVDRYVAKRRDEFAEDSTIGKELIALNQLCKLAKRGGEYAGDIASLWPVGFDASSTARTTTLTPQQVGLLLDELKPQQAATVALALAVGGRRSEVRCIRREDVDLVAWTVRIRGTKTAGSDRHIPIPLPAQRALLIRAVEAGLPARWPSVSSSLPKICERLGLPRATPNDLRRSFATWGIEAGVLRSDVARLLGHRSTAMVFRVYGQETAGALGAKIDRDLAAEPGTSASHYGRCVSGTSLESRCFLGVTDGDRTRDNRSHNPSEPTEQWPVCELFAGETLGVVPPNTTESHALGTTASHSALAQLRFRKAAWDWFRRAA